MTDSSPVLDMFVSDYFLDPHTCCPLLVITCYCNRVLLLAALDAAEASDGSLIYDGNE